MARATDQEVLMATAATNYDKPEMRERIKARVTAGDKGGRPGQWSARKAQLVAREYEAAGGGYRGPPAPGQSHLRQWTAERWQTKDGSPAGGAQSMHRYLPKEAWDRLTPAEREATDKKKVAGGRGGKQFVSNTPAARRARKAATGKGKTRIGAP
jgi:hypothetical protein